MNKIGTINSWKTIISLDSLAIFHNSTAGHGLFLHPLFLRRMIEATSTDKENPVTGLRQEARSFNDRKRKQADEAGQVAAFFLAVGVDLSTALASTGNEREHLCLRLRRLIERERLRGSQRHWSYDLNRHIALKQALQRLGDHKTLGATTVDLQPCLEL